MTDAELLAAADAIASRAYAPYSNFEVGCAVLCRDGHESDLHAGLPLPSAPAMSGVAP